MSSFVPTKIDPGTARRLVGDIVALQKNPLTDHGIFYEHDAENMLLGRAMIVGPTDTPYAHGYFFFDFIFPPNYPHSPPKVVFRTRGGANTKCVRGVRFGPNLYRDGKVCISILNTWPGDAWSGCQTISSVLLSLCGLLVANPLLNEPGITTDHPEIEAYNKFISYASFVYAHRRVGRGGGDTTLPPIPDEKYIAFRDTIVQIEIEKHDEIERWVASLRNLLCDGEELRCDFFDMYGTADHKMLRK
jgi:ubiquitin-protein ligase